MKDANQHLSQQKSDGRNRFSDTLTNLVVNNLVLGIIILLILGIVLLVIGYVSFPNVPSFITDLCKQIGGAILVTGVITGLLRILILGSYNKFVDQNSMFLRDDVTERLNEVKGDIEHQTKALVETVASLEAMNELNIVRVYSQRKDACKDIEKDIQKDDISQIDISGVSLNDFVGGTDRDLNPIWRIIKEFVKGSRKLPKGNESATPKLDIRVMVVDPNCWGAMLRSYGENRKPGGSLSRLPNDVMGTINDLRVLEESAKKNQERTGVTFQLRLYRLPPQLFLISTDKVSYIEPYHFWSSRGTSMPLFRCGDSQSDGDTDIANLHRGMKDHFDLIWKLAAIESSAFRDEGSIGVDEGLYQSGIVNVFQDHKEARLRLLWLLQHAKRRIYIQGITLRSFFDGKVLNLAINELVERGNVEIKILLLDPQSDQARYRSYREYLLNNPVMKREDFWARKDLHEQTDLYRDTNKTIESIRGMKNKLQNGTRISLKMYESASACFMLLIDDTVLVEPYHYGNLQTIPPTTVSAILGEDTTLVEYTQPNSKRPDVYPSHVETDTVGLMEDHFNFVFNQCGRECLSSDGDIMPSVAYRSTASTQTG